MTAEANDKTAAHKETVSNTKFSDTFRAFTTGHATVTDLLHSLGKAHGMTHFNTALVLGKNPIAALKADLQKFNHSKAVVKSKDYFRAWMIATHGGSIKGHDLPTPPSVTETLAPKSEVGAAGKRDLISSLYAVGFGGWGLTGGGTPAAQALMMALQKKDLPAWFKTDEGRHVVSIYQHAHAGLPITGNYTPDTVAALKADGISFPPAAAYPAPKKMLVLHLGSTPFVHPAPNAVPVPIDSHPTQDAAMAAPVSLTQPIPVPVDQAEIVAATGAPVVAPVPAPGSSFQAAAPNPQWKLGGAAALAVPGFFVAGPPGAAGGAIAGLLGGKVLDDKIKQGLMQPIFARDAAGKISLSLSLKKWTGNTPPPAQTGNNSPRTGNTPPPAQTGNNSPRHIWYAGTGD